MKVDYCKHSTITEAWAVLLGPPGAFTDDGAIRVLEYVVKGQFPGLEREPTMAFAAQGEEVAPFWLMQLRLDARHRVRLGHHFVSIHFVREHGDADRYERYTESLEPQVRAMARAIAESPVADQFPISRVAFGYVNTIDLPRDADSSDYFKVALKTDLKVAESGLDAADVRLRVSGGGSLSQVELSLSSASGSLRATSKVFVEQESARTMRYGDDKVHDLVTVAKDAAKELFFDFATEALHGVMGATYVEE